jgi:hypothetical protein
MQLFCQDLAFIEELQYGVHDDECEGLTPKEINMFYDLNDDQEVQGSDEESDQLDDSERDDNYEESEADVEMDEPESDDSPVLDFPFDMEVCSHFITFLT